MNRADVIVRKGIEAVGCVVHERQHGRQCVLFNPDDRQGQRCEWCLIPAAPAPRAAARESDRRPGIGALSVSLLSWERALDVDVIAAGCPSGLRGTSQSDEDHEDPYSLGGDDKCTRQVSFHGSRWISTEVKEAHYGSAIAFHERFW